MYEFTLTSHEREALLTSHTNGSGGWQALLRKLKNQLDAMTSRLHLDGSDLERIRRYAFAYGQGGWEDQLVTIFGRHLGPDLQGGLK